MQQHTSYLHPDDWDVQVDILLAELGEPYHLYLQLEELLEELLAELLLYDEPLLLGENVMRAEKSSKNTMRATDPSSINKS